MDAGLHIHAMLSHVGWVNPSSPARTTSLGPFLFSSNGRPTRTVQSLFECRSVHTHVMPCTCLPTVGVGRESLEPLRVTFTLGHLVSTWSGIEENSAVRLKGSLSRRRYPGVIYPSIECMLSIPPRPPPPRPTPHCFLRDIAGHDIVDDDDHHHDRLEFLLSGKGTMPTVTLESPLERHQSGDVVMEFGEVSLPRLYLYRGFGDLFCWRSILEAG